MNKDDLPAQIDLSDPRFAQAISISALNKEVDALSNHLANLFETPSFQWTPRLSNERQIGLLELALQDLKNAKQAMLDGVETDLIEIDLVASHDHLKEILGEVHREDLLDTLFSNLKNAKQAMLDGVETDLIEIDLVASHDHLKEILGEVHREDLLDTLFSNFCLGK